MSSRLRYSFVAIPSWLTTQGKKTGVRYYLTHCLAPTVCIFYPCWAHALWHHNEEHRPMKRQLRRWMEMITKYVLKSNSNTFVIVSIVGLDHYVSATIRSPSNAVVPNVAVLYACRSFSQHIVVWTHPLSLPPTATASCRRCCARQWF